MLVCVAPSLAGSVENDSLVVENAACHSSSWHGSDTRMHVNVLVPCCVLHTNPSMGGFLAVAGSIFLKNREHCLMDSMGHSTAKGYQYHVNK